MKVFEQANFSEGVVCPVCGNDSQKPVVLVAKEWTCDDNGIVEVVQVHVECLGEPSFYVSDFDEEEFNRNGSYIEIISLTEDIYMKDEIKGDKK